MPVLRWPHDRHRDLRARLHPAHASHKRDQNRHVMTVIVSPRYRNAPRPCRSSIGHSAACFARQLGPLWKRRLSINVPPLNRNDLLSHRIRLDHCARSTCRNSNPASAAPQIPIAPEARRTFPQRGFLPWRLSDAGPQRARRRQSSGRHPKPFTLATVGRSPRENPLYFELWTFAGA
jgi:hypothetical protein